MRDIRRVVVSDLRIGFDENSLLLAVYSCLSWPQALVWVRLNCFPKAHSPKLCPPVQASYLFFHRMTKLYFIMAPSSRANSTYDGFSNLAICYHGMRQPSFALNNSPAETNHHGKPCRPIYCPYEKSNFRILRPNSYCGGLVVGVFNGKHPPGGWRLSGSRSQPLTWIEPNGCQFPAATPRFGCSPMLGPVLVG